MLYAAVGLIWLDALLGLDEMMKEEYQRFMFFSASALLLLIVLAANPRVTCDNYFCGGFIIIIIFLQFKLI